MRIAYSPLVPLVESYVAIYKIYVLKNPLRDNEIFYVGQTYKELQQRLSGHITETGANRDKINYIKEIIDAGSRPIIESIEVIRGTCYIDKMMVNERELYWIRYYLTIGCKLLNLSGISSGSKCNEYHGYLAHIKRGEASWHYYYCGKTAGGYEVYDEEKLKADGFRLVQQAPITPIIPYPVYEHNYNPLEYNKFRLKIGLPIIERPSYLEEEVTTIFPEQPAWSGEFKKGIPPYNSLRVELYLEYSQEESDYEPEESDNDTSDFEPEHDDQEDDDYADIEEKEYKKSLWVNSLTILNPPTT
jgi:hypothetical protein